MFLAIGNQDVSEKVYAAYTMLLGHLHEGTHNGVCKMKYTASRGSLGGRMVSNDGNWVSASVLQLQCIITGGQVNSKTAGLDPTLTKRDRKGGLSHGPASAIRNV